MKGWELGGRLVVLLHWRILRIRIMHCEIKGGVRARQEGIGRRTHLDRSKAPILVHVSKMCLKLQKRFAVRGSNTRWFIDEKRHQDRSSSWAGLTLGWVRSVPVPKVPLVNASTYSINAELLLYKVYLKLRPQVRMPLTRMRTGPKLFPIWKEYKV